MYAPLLPPTLLADARTSLTGSGRNLLRQPQKMRSARARQKFEESLGRMFHLVGSVNIRPNWGKFTLGRPGLRA
jgi:hypothetical protein